MIRIVTDSSTLYSVSQGKTKGINIAPLIIEHIKSLKKYNQKNLLK